MGDKDSPAVVGKYVRATGAPAGLRKVAKLGEITRWMEYADESRIVQARLHAGRAELVRELRGRGASWGAIGWVFGVSGAAVHKSYRGDVPK